MEKIDWKKARFVVKGWRLGDYFRQFSIVAAGIIVTFWGSDRITERSRQKEVHAMMQLVTEELEHNRKELHEIKSLLDIDVHMSALLIENKMDISEIPTDTLWKYGQYFNNMNEFYYRTDALDVLKGSSLMQYISDKRLLQDVLQTYFQLERIKKDVTDYYGVKTNTIMTIAMTQKSKKVLAADRTFRDEVSELLQCDSFINFTIMVQGFLDWDDFASLDQMLDKQIQTLRAKYK